MPYRRRHRWFRRIALGLTFASALLAGRVSPEAAAAEAIHDPVPPRISAEYGDSRELPEPFVSSTTDFPPAPAQLPAVRPDDVADRFAHSDVAARPEPTSRESWRIQWDDALMLAAGTFVSSLALGLALSYLRRPRLAAL